MKMSNKTYDILKVVALILLPLAALVASLGDIWGFNGQPISQTLIAIDTFLGVILKQSSDKYMEERDAAVDE